MNILICSVGRRVQLLNYFSEELGKIGGVVIAADCDPNAPALYHADAFEIVPEINHTEYIPSIKNICQKYNIKGVFSLIDPELTLLARHKDEFLNDGIQIFVSDKQVVDTCYDKLSTYQFLKENNIMSVRTYDDITKVILDLEEGIIDFPLIVKPRCGSGSAGIKKIASIAELQLLWEANDNLIVQPYIEGIEYSADCYIDLLNNKVTNLFSKRKVNMRAGESDKSIAVKDRQLTEIVIRLIELMKLSGPIDIDFFKTNEGYVVSEINPRFGGGYPYAHQMGHNFIKSIINNLNGISNPPFQIDKQDYSEGKIMVRYDQYMVL